MAVDAVQPSTSGLHFLREMGGEHADHLDIFQTAAPAPMDTSDMGVDSFELPSFPSLPNSCEDSDNEDATKEGES